MKKQDKKEIIEEANQSKGMGNPGGSQSGGTAEKETVAQLKDKSKKEKQKRRNSAR